MLSIKLIKVGSEAYYLDLAREDYYFNGGEPPGQWIGSGCSYFFLAGVVQRDHFKSIFNGFHPRPPDDSAEPLGLVQNAGKKKRRAGWDLCFSAPKSVSIIWSQASEEMQRRIQELHHQAIVETIKFLEEKLAYSRTGKAGSGTVKAKLVAGVFEHGTSRAGDPQLHSHVVVMNIGVNEPDPQDSEPKKRKAGETTDGRREQVRSIEPKPIYKNKMLLGAVYRSHLAHFLHEEFGFNALRKGNSFEIQGVPNERIEDASKRRKQVLRRLHEQGKSGAVAAAAAAVETREKKLHVARKTLIEEWRLDNEKFGFNDGTLQALVCPVATNYLRHIDKICKTAFENLTRRLNHFTAHEFLREVLYVAPEYGASPGDLEEPVNNYLCTSQDIIRIPTTDGSSRFVAASVLHQELEMLNELQRLQKRQGLQVSDAILIKVLGTNSLLNREQRMAVRHLTQGTAAIRVIQGYAGTGKTTMLRTAVKAWKASGFNIVGACFTGAAAEVLEQEIGVPCDTINMTLADFNGDIVETLRRWGKHSFKQLARVATGKSKKGYAYKPPQPVDINRRTIIVVDEAGSVNTRHMQMLMKWANDNKATLVLTGDEAQTPAVEGGSPLYSITRRVGCTKMTDIKRQQDYWACSAAHYLARGEIAKALALYDLRGLLKVDEDIDEALDRLIRDWDAHSFDCPHQSRILTLTNDLAHKANQLAQQRLLDRKMFNTDSSHIIRDVNKESGKTYESRVHVGDRVLFTKNDRTYNVRNGQTGWVIGFTWTTKKRLQQALKVRLDNGRVVRIPIGFQNIRLGYASTVHKAQGSTYDEVFVLLGGGAQNLPISYVQGTRSRWATHFYTERALYDQIEDLGESLLVSQMELDVDLSLAADLFVPPSGMADNQNELIEKLLKDWKDKELGKSTSLVLTKDDELAGQVNAAIHKHQYAMAQTEWDKWRLADPNERGRTEMPTFTANGRTLVVGDRVRFLQHSPHKIIQKHELGTVTEITPETQTLEVELDRGKTERMAMDRVPKFDHGYAVSHEQADLGRYQVQNAYLLQPETFRSTEMTPAYSTNVDYFQWNPQTTQPQTVFSSVNYTYPGTQYSFQSANTYSYSTTPQYTQMAADWHQKTYSINQAPSFQIQPGYSYTTTHSHYQQGW